jgi:CBS domain containing-hemolysin-like protein
LSPTLEPIVLAVAAAAVGSLFASADAALTSLPEARLQALVDQGGEPTFARFAADRLGVLSRWLVARVIALSIASILLARAVEQDLGPMKSALVAVVVAVLTYATFAEILGTVARRRPEQVGRVALRLLQPLEWAVVPLAAPLAALGRWIGRKVPESTDADARLTETDLEWLVDKGEKAGAIEKEPATMIRNVLDFKHLTAKEVMIPRRRVSSIEASTPLTDVLEHVRIDGHSRYPVFRETLDNVVGLLYVKDLFDVVGAGKLAETKLEALIRKPVLFLAEAQPALSVLREMRSKRLHLAVVTDEFGGTGGIVTLEDIIEEIVGEIRDEYDTEDVALIQKLAEGRFVADAAIPLDELELHLGQKLPEDGAFESLGGLIVHRAGRVPEVGATVSLDGYELIVREADETRVVKVEIVRAEPSLVPPPPAEVTGDR